MKKVIFCVILSVALAACTQAPKTDETASKRASALALYQQNMTALKTGLQAFQNEQIDIWAQGIADNCVWNSGMYGSSPGTKADWSNVLSSYATDWDSIRLNNAVYLPGLDSASFEPDGSVRYYGQWTGLHKSGVRTSINFYGTYEFDTTNKIVNASDYFDMGGMMNAVMAKSKQK